MGTAASVKFQHCALAIPVLTDDVVAELHAMAGSATDSRLSVDDVKSALLSMGLAEHHLLAVTSRCPPDGATVQQFTAAYSEVAQRITAKRHSLEAHARYRAVTLRALLAFTTQYDLWSTPTHE